MVKTKFDGPKGTKPAKKKTSGVKKRSKSTPLKEIQNQQQSSEQSPPRLTFKNVVRDGQLCRSDLNPAMAAFQEAAESHIMNLLEDSSLCALYSKRTTVLPKDVKLAQRLRGESE